MIKMDVTIIVSTKVPLYSKTMKEIGG